MRAIAILAATVCLLVAAAPGRAFPDGRYPAVGTGKPLRPDVVAYWLRLHMCEQPAGWYGGYPRYPGGLGILAANWTWAAGELGLLGRYPDGGKAPPLVQVRVADYGFRRLGWGWGCFSVVGRPPR